MTQLIFSRIVLKHGKDVVWQKNTMVDVRAALFGILGRSVVSQLQNNTGKCEESEVRFYLNAC